MLSLPMSRFGTIRATYRGALAINFLTLLLPALYSTLSKARKTKDKGYGNHTIEIKSYGSPILRRRRWSPPTSTHSQCSIKRNHLRFFVGLTCVHFDSVGVITEIVNEGLSRVAFNVIGNKERGEDVRRNMGWTLIAFQAICGALLSIAFVVAAPAFSSAFVPSEVQSLE